MAFKFFLGFGLGVVFIILSGLFIGGIPFADFLLNFNFSDNFIIFGVPYGVVAGIIYLLIRKFRGTGGNLLISGILFGAGFNLSFAILYLIMYFAFSGFQGL